MKTLIAFLLCISSLWAQGAREITASTLSALKFRSIGPALISGRISDIAVDPSDSSRWFVAVASGGVWRSENNGTTFVPVFDAQSCYSIGCVSIDPNNRHVIWVGSGENNSQRSVSWGHGVFRSRDGGKTWQNMGLSKSEHIGKIVVDPRDSNIVWVAAQGPLWRSGGDRGLYKSIDSGKTWRKVLAISEDTGVNEVHLDPRNPDIAYASTYQRRRKVWTVVNGGPESAIYKTNDGGASWRKLQSGLPRVDLGRIGMAISPVNPDVVYAIIEAQRGQGGTFRSSDRGESWRRMSDKVARSPQYYQELVADPVDVDTIYCLDTHTTLSRDGGRTWVPLGNKGRHVDDHALWIDPSNPKHLVIGGDGGIYQSYDAGANWDYCENLPLAQFYRVSADQALPFYNIYGGTQDNNSVGGPSRTTSRGGICNEDWFVTVGGDGYEVQVDPTDPNIVYTQSQYAGIVRHDRRSGENTDIKPRPVPGGPLLIWNWDTPLLLSAHSHKRLYLAGNHLFRTDDRGDSWKMLSGNLSRGIDRDGLPVMGRIQEVDAVAKNRSTSVYGNSVSLTESPLNENLLYVGTDDGLVHMTRNAGATWSKYASFDGVPDRCYVSRLEASRHVEGRVYAAFNNHKNGDFKPYLLVSENYGATWRSIAANLPASDAVWSIAEDHENENLLFVGTEFGVYVSFDRGGRWIRMRGGLPTIAVRDIEIQRRENDLILGTFGRGFYVLDDYSMLRTLSKELLARPAQLFAIRKAPLYIERSRLGRASGLGTQGATFFAAPNPPFGAMMTIYLRDGLRSKRERREAAQAKARRGGKTLPYPSDEDLRAEDAENTPAVFVTIRDASGAVLRRIDAPRRKGLHRIAWDLRYPSAMPARLGRESGKGPLVLGGRFTATLEQEVEGIVTALTEPVPFEVEALHLASLPAADRAELLAFQKDVVELRRSVHASVRLLADLQARVDLARVALRRSRAADLRLLRSIEALDQRLAGLRRVLSGDSSLSSRYKPSPMSIQQRIQSVASAQLRSSSAPTQTQRDAYGYAAEAFAPVLKQLRELASKDLPAVEQALELAGAGDTPGRLPQWKKQG
ncbi:MAG: glycosyl hydrolase [Planctomycetota bacterium]|nr:MAG: glycosyl hydrolase [Planctomycetota bacterium]